MTTKLQTNPPSNSPKGALITLTPEAVTRYREMMKEQNKENFGLRIRVISGGCSGMQYEMGFEKDPEAIDLVVESNGQKIFVDPKSVKYLTGLHIHYTKGLTGAGFKIKNPNAEASCGCGESFS